jgi:hypothetical protein
VVDPTFVMTSSMSRPLSMDLSVHAYTVPVPGTRQTRYRVQTDSVRCEHLKHRAEDGADRYRYRSVLGAPPHLRLSA